VVGPKSYSRPSLRESCSPIPAPSEPKDLALLKDCRRHPFHDANDAIESEYGEIDVSDENEVENDATDENVHSR
jgi:hypothetical protein